VTKLFPKYEAVIASNRNMVAAYRNLGNCKLLTGSIEEAISLEQHAIRISPGDPQMGWMCWRIGTAHLLLSRVDEAIGWLERARRDEVAFRGRVNSWLASGYALKGEVDRAAAELTEARRLSNHFSSIARLRVAGGAAGAPGYWGVPKVRALFEATYFAGLRRAGIPEA
jgi:tetratricopeptide (TPR) repeat protein